MKIRDLLVGAQPKSVGGVEDGYLLEEDSLQEVELVDVWVDTTWASVALLVDLRGALQLDEGNVGVVLLSGIRDLNWRFPGEQWVPMARTIIDSSFEVGTSITASVGMTAGGGTIGLRARRCSIWTGDIPGMSEAPPNYVEDPRDAVDRETPAWDSEFVPLRWAVAVALTDPAPTAGRVPSE
ncbi:hypothetical protein [Actinokineospora globicatena]|uniref:Uncharacterized protein n=1 Tax=Actinokineospora globicatena TaxID=103729 RepID=A0A9W6QK90_9PSEU|nr:hypothetical protein [Actinokineospora globicatena]GLW91988.1 hypothetical protein Aglo03_28040 [Actinokineospora globicatena]